jgi:DNA-binding NtrC family response regulator
MNIKPLIILDDEIDALHSVRATLLSFKYSNIVMCNSTDEFWKTLREQSAELILLDLMMPFTSGDEILKTLNEDFPGIPVIMTTGVNEIETAVRCMRGGAFDYLVKPINRDQLRVAVARAMKLRELERCNEALSTSLLREELSHPETFKLIKTTSPKMRSIFKYIEAVAPSSHSILISGETGTGKELVARAIHSISQREGEFVALNVAGLDDTVFSDTLFGHVKGAFTGADSVRGGAVEKAAGGTLFLDEIGDLSIHSQVKLLRLLQENEFLPLGTDTTKRSTCRIVTATSRPIEYLKDSDAFRKDLYYRLKTHHVRIPSLRERKEDIPVMVQYFLECASKEFNKPLPTPHKELYTLLSIYHFPGNVRELKGMIYDAVANHEGRMMSLSSIKSAIGLLPISTTPEPATNISTEKLLFLDELPTFKEADSLLLGEALRRSKGNRSLAASLLGVSRSAISQRLGNLNNNN